MPSLPAGNFLSITFAVARHSGMRFLHHNRPAAEQVTDIRAVNDFKAGFAICTGERRCIRTDRGFERCSVCRSAKWYLAPSVQDTPAVSRAERSGRCMGAHP
ncbi:hypothetical protein DDJ91_12425 [Mycobacteroides abscessus]|nr:hypothetical protein DDJ91_12425 [Mycobacteroides abscessus]